jgi:hypothetical protein
MNLQFYEMMDDKSKDYLLYLSEQILPQFTEGDLQVFFADNDSKPLKGGKGSKAKTTKVYEKLNPDAEKVANLSKLTLEQLKLLFQTFISREKSDKTAIKWRFYQFIRYMLGLNLKSLQINRDPKADQYIDFIIETEENEVYLALCYDLLELNDYNKAVKQIIDFAKKENLLPDKIIFATSKSFRNIPLDTPIKIVSKEILPILWVEWTEENRRFKKEDLLIVNDSELKLAGFNYTSTEDLLNYVYKYSNGGQTSIFRQMDYFTEVSDDEPEVDLIWKGIMLKQ